MKHNKSPEEKVKHSMLRANWVKNGSVHQNVQVIFIQKLQA